MKRLILITFLASFFVIAPNVSYAGPFGGQIILIRPCFNFSAWQILIGPPTPMSLIYQAGVSRSYLYGPPWRPGQWLLGVAGAMGVCDIDPSKFFNGQNGSMIFFHGSSM